MDRFYRRWILRLQENLRQEHPPCAEGCWREREHQMPKCPEGTCKHKQFLDTLPYRIYY